MNKLLYAAITITVFVLGQMYYFTLNDVEYTPYQTGGLLIIMVIELSIASFCAQVSFMGKQVNNLKDKD